MGRSRKIYIKGEEPVMKSILLPAYVWDLFPRGRPLNHSIKEMALAAFGQDGKFEKQQLDMEIQEIEAKLAGLVARRSVVERKEKEKEELRRAMNRTAKYLASAFRLLVSEIVKNGGTSILLKEEFVRSRYGITFNRKKANEDFEELWENIREMSDTDLIETYELVKDRKGDLEDQIFKLLEESGK